MCLTSTFKPVLTNKKLLKIIDKGTISSETFKKDRRILIQGHMEARSAATSRKWQELLALSAKNTTK
jgi:hypothetical protein